MLRRSMEQIYYDIDKEQKEEELKMEQEEIKQAEAIKLQVKFIELVTGTSFRVRSIIKTLPDSIMFVETNDEADTVYEIFYKNIAFIEYEEKKEA